MSLGINALDPMDRMTYIHPDPNLHPLGICQFCGISVYPHPYEGRYVWQAFPGQPHHHPMCVTEDRENIIIDNVDWVEKIKSIATPPREGHGGGTGGKGGKGGTGYVPAIGRLPLNVGDIYKAGVLNIPGYATVPVAENVLFGDLITSYKDRNYAADSVFGPKLGLPKAICRIPDGIHLFQFKPEKYNRTYLFGSIFTVIEGMANIACVNRSWEHIDYYFGFCIRELNVMMGRFQFEEVLEKSRELINVFSEAKDLFGVIKTYNGTEQPLRSELLGKAYGVQVEVMINLLNKKPELLDEAIAASDRAINEFSDHRDLSRQYQWRCLLLICAGKPGEALEWLLKAQESIESSNPIESFVNEAYMMKPGTYDFLLWHYSNIMVLFKEQDDPRGDQMAKALMSHPRFLEDLANEDKKNHPWQLILWNCGKYARMNGNLSVYKQMHRKAMGIACCNRENVTMMTFAISISADRLSWCRKTEAKDTPNAEIEFMNTIKQIKQAGTTEEMDRHFMIDPKNLPAMLNSDLDYLKKAYLR